MKKMLYVVLAFFIVSAVYAETQWCLLDGTIITGSVTKYDHRSIVIRGENDKFYRVPLQNLSLEAVRVIIPEISSGELKRPSQVSNGLYDSKLERAKLLERARFFVFGCNEHSYGRILAVDNSGYYFEDTAQNIFFVNRQEAASDKRLIQYLKAPECHIDEETNEYRLSTMIPEWKANMAEQRLKQIEQKVISAEKEMDKSLDRIRDLEIKRGVFVN